MKIECILHRPGGTVVEFPGKTYHFQPQDDGRHVADVEIEAHIERLLSIPEAYRLFRTRETDEAALVVTPATDNPPDVTIEGDLLASSGYPETFDINGKTYALGDIVAHAFKDSGLTTDDWNGLDEDTRATKIDIVLDALEAGEVEIAETGADTEKADDQVKSEREALVAQYREKFGKNPGRMSEDRMKALLEGEA